MAEQIGCGHREEFVIFGNVSAVMTFTESLCPECSRKLQARLESVTQENQELTTKLEKLRRTRLRVMQRSLDLSDENRRLRKFKERISIELRAQS